ncbi:adenylate/guanylate cyclase domain-containing protein [Armatimonas sp.]|uniref:adenylate/guanylate cyclase domain-containing protein n=1 Tax=Armatimonas sp. TaxID=1872638 RepID=UPI00286CB1CF|nr:adenylate/guanylate cyclase domain-containing protein [Armatimonas sp.]
MAQQQQLQPEPPRYDEQTLRQAIQLADRLQAEHKERYSADDIEKIAAEIGVQPEFVHKALNDIEDKHEAQKQAEPPKKSTIPIVTVQAQQVNEAMRQAGEELRGTTKNFIQMVAQKLDEANLEQMKGYVGTWWGTAWLLMPIADAIGGRRFDEPLTALAAVTYIGFGIYLGKRLDAKKKEAELAAKVPVPPVSASLGVAPPVRYSVETSGVSREELLAQMIQIQKRLEGERVRRTFMSVDVVGSTELKRSADDLLVEYSFNQYRRFVEEIVLAEGGQVQSTAGDGTMAMFETEAAGVRAALKLQESMASFNAQHNRLPKPFHVRVGVNAGEVALMPGQPIGYLQSAVIDRAAALQKSAAPDDIIVAGDLSPEALATLGRYGRHANSPEGGVRGFSWRAGF